MTDIALTIAGFDSDRGVEIQVDLQTFVIYCSHGGSSTITCVTLQNTCV